MGDARVILGHPLLIILCACMRLERPSFKFANLPKTRIPWSQIEEDLMRWKQDQIFDASDPT